MIIRIASHTMSHLRKPFDSAVCLVLEEKLPSHYEGRIGVVCSRVHAAFRVNPAALFCCREES